MKIQHLFILFLHCFLFLFILELFQYTTKMEIDNNNFQIQIFDLFIDRGFRLYIEFGRLIIMTVDVIYLCVQLHEYLSKFVLYTEV